MEPKRHRALPKAQAVRNAGTSLTEPALPELCVHNGVESDRLRPAATDPMVLFHFVLFGEPGDWRAWSSSFVVGCRLRHVPPTLPVALRTPYGRHGVQNHAVKGRMPTNEGEAPPKPLALAVVRKAIEESRGRAAHVTGDTCRLCGSPTVETYSSLPWGTQVRLLVCPDVHCGAVAAVPARPLHDSPPLGPGTKSS